METRFCPKCGCKLLPDATSCGFCGHTLPVSAPVQPIIQQPVMQQPVIQQPVIQQPIIQQPVIQQPIIQQPVIQQPIIQQPVVQKSEEPPEEAPTPQARPKLYTLDTLPPAPPKENAPTPAPKVESKWPRRGFVRGCIAVLLCLTIFLLSFCSLAWISLHSFATSDHTAAVLEDTLRNLPLIRIKLPGKDGNIPLADWLDNQLDGTLNMSVRVDPEALQVFLRDSQTTALFAEHIAGYMNAFFTGEHAVLSPDVLYDTLLQDRDLLGNVLYRTLSEDDIHYIVDRLATAGILDRLSTDKLPTPAFTTVRATLSWWVIASLGLLILVLLIALVFVDRNIFRGLGDMGISLVATGSLWGLAYLVWQILISLTPWRLRPFMLLPNHYLVTGLIPCAIFFGTGIVLLIVKAIVKTLILRKEKKAHT